MNDGAADAGSDRQAARRPRRRVRQLAAHWLPRPGRRRPRLRVDGDLVELHDGPRTATVDLRALAAVEVVHTPQAPGEGAVDWVLRTDHGAELAVPSRAMAEPLLGRLLALPGFDREALAAATAGRADGTVRCWTARPHG